MGLPLAISILYNLNHTITLFNHNTTHNHISAVICHLVSPPVSSWHSQLSQAAGQQQHHHLSSIRCTHLSHQAHVPSSLLVHTCPLSPTSHIFCGARKPQILPSCFLPHFQAGVSSSGLIWSGQIGGFDLEAFPLIFGRALPFPTEKFLVFLLGRGLHPWNFWGFLGHRLPRVLLTPSFYLVTVVPFLRKGF